MNFHQHDVLKYIYTHTETSARSLMDAMTRKYKDHRDFYPLAGLILDGYIGFTGAPFDLSFNSEGPTNHQNAYLLSRMLQCYSQGRGTQTYQGVQVFGGEEDSTFFIAAKGLIYFHELKERRREWWTVAFLGLASAIIAGCVTGLLVSSGGT
ncbi:hypothetical protein V0R48_09765 [Pseudomonas alcaligenes]|uniref:hypothetical protein n=1 Tax=Aquipseudomonas alcaligenes TaxID=43263 RepID=UPI002E7BBDF6|nr:hypothetical protein [Pseudomonas alcaligenes]MEE1949260.1 hypothetical protein [Pseudomonas alcaligenes]